METKFSLKVTMNDETYKKLKDGNRNLIIMKAVESSEGEGSKARPLAWICLNPNYYGQEVTIKWTESYRAYTSTDKIIAGAEVGISNSYPIKLGQTLNVENPNGSGYVENAGKGGAVCISNLRDHHSGEPDLICGIMQANRDDQSSSQLCAFPLLPNTLEIIAPINKIFVTFASDIKKVGAVVERSLHKGIMLEYKEGETSREIHFDINTGFKPDHLGGIENIEPTPDLAKRLILPSSSYLKLKSDFDSKIRLKTDVKAKHEELKNLVDVA